jgi:hypothetical protein
MRLFLITLLSISTSFYGWSGSLANHIQEQCHVVKGEHHTESLAAHEKAHHEAAGHESHDSKKDCEPEHCSDHCTVCHVSMSGIVNAGSETQVNHLSIRNDKVSMELEKISSISLRPDTPPPKA